MSIYNFLINGELISSTHTFEVRNPATNELLGEAAIANEDDVNAAVNAAKAAQPAWALRSDEERKAILMQVADVLSKNSAYLSEWITKEQGKPLNGPGSRFELEACIAFTQVPASLDLPIETIFEDDVRKDELHREPLGVVGAIAPWNWPLMIAIWQIAPALRVGNTVILKPSEYTTIGTLEMVRLINEVLPPGVLNVISGKGDVGSWLVANPKVNKIMFTGSTKTGKKVIAASQGNMARLTLECGGNDPAIILPGTDFKKIAVDLFWGTFLNMGQTCACIKRLYVHEDDYESVITEMDNVAAYMPIGNGMDDKIMIGSVQNQMQLDIVSMLVEDAKANGARIIRGGSKLDGPGFFYPITLVADIDNGSRLVDEEQFGPVLPIIKYRRIEEAIEKANDSNAGLGASVWGEINAATNVARQIQAGTVWINQHGAIHPLVPFGGIKESGYGVEFGLEGLKSVTQSKIISTKK